VCARKVRMHADEVDTDVSLVRRLLAAQFPDWAELPIVPVPSAGTDNALYRLGDRMVVRLPRIGWATGQVDKEARWLPRLAPHLPLAVPVPVATGEPAEGYPWRWSVAPWLAGEDAAAAPIADLVEAARELAGFVAALQRIDPADGPPARGHARGMPLAVRDEDTRKAIAALEGDIDTAAATAAWDAALRAPASTGSPVWYHGDILPGNILVVGGRVRAVIDFSALGVGDPACDLMIAWNLFSGESRDAYRSALAVDDAMWARGRGHALSQALQFIPYYRDTNPRGVAVARRAVSEVLADLASDG
jgi:aminoglycoside phosphotransferase (APT) family kinase protein